MNTVWTVALRELADQVGSFRFWIITILVVVLAPLIVYVGARDYSERRAESGRLAADLQKMVNGPAGKAVRTLDIGNSLEVLRAIRTPEILSVLVRGLDAGLPEYWDFYPTGMRVGPAASRAQRLADVLGSMDLEFLVRVILGLLAILMAFDAVTGEKELGTLRAVLSHPVPRAAFMGGKLAGGGITLLLALTALFAVTLVSALAFGVNLLEAGMPAKLALVAGAAALYLICVLALGLLVSATTNRQKTSLVVLLVLWVGLALAATPMATIVAQAIVPVPPPHAVETKKTAVDHDLHYSAAEAMGVQFREITGLPMGVGNQGIYEKNKDAIDKRIVPIVVDYVNKRRRLVRGLEQDAERRFQRQNQLAGLFMRLSPAAAFSAAVADLAGTGDAGRAAWMEAVRRHQTNLDSALFDNPPSVVISSGTLAFLADIRKPPSISSLPRFVAPRRDAAVALERGLPALGLLALYSAIFVASGFFAFSRYDVR